MKYITTAIVWMSLVMLALSCVMEDVVTSNRVDNFPLLGYTEKWESRDDITFMIYIRDTGNFEGLNDVKTKIKDKTGSTLFYTGLSVDKTEHKGLFRVSFNVGKDILDCSELWVFAEKNDGFGINTIIGEVVSVHTCIYIYKFNIKMLYEKYKDNDLFKHSQDDKYYGKKLEAFLRKKFTKNREKSQPSDLGDKK